MSLETDLPCLDSLPAPPGGSDQEADEAPLADLEVAHVVDAAMQRQPEPAEANSATTVGNLQHVRDAPVERSAGLPPFTAKAPAPAPAPPHSRSPAGGSRGPRPTVKQQRSNPNLALPNSDRMAAHARDALAVRAPRSSSSNLQLPPINRGNVPVAGAAPLGLAAAVAPVQHGSWTPTPQASLDCTETTELFAGENGTARRQTSFAALMAANGVAAATVSSSSASLTSTLRMSQAGRHSPATPRVPDPRSKSLSQVQLSQDLVLPPLRLVSPSRKKRATYDDVILHYSRSAQAWVKEALPKAGRGSGLGTGTLRRSPT